MAELLDLLRNSEFREYLRDRVGIAGLIELARSYVLVLPRDWVNQNCDLIEGDAGKAIPWVRFMEGDDDQLIITPYSKEKLLQEIQDLHLDKEKLKKTLGDEDVISTFP